MKGMEQETTRQTLFVVSAIIVRDRTILATQRGYGDYTGWWEFPGGKIQEGESPEAALHREIREELAATIAIDRYFDTVDYDYPGFHLSMQCYLCTLISREIRLTEHLSATWFHRANAFDRRWLAADIPILEKLLAEKIL